MDDAERSGECNAASLPAADEDDAGKEPRGDRGTASDSGGHAGQEQTRSVGLSQLLMGEESREGNDAISAVERGAATNGSPCGCSSCMAGREWWTAVADGASAAAGWWMVGGDVRVCRTAR